MFTSLVVPPYAFQSLPSSLRLATFVAGCTSVTEQVTSLSFSDIDSQPWFQRKPHIVVSLLYRPRNAPSMYTSSRAWDKHRPHRNPPKKALLKRSNFGSSRSAQVVRGPPREFSTLHVPLILLLFNKNRSAGPMARRLTTNQEIAGSIPASINDNSSSNGVDLYILLSEPEWSFCTHPTANTEVTLSGPHVFCADEGDQRCI
jgi:hypothetical protein